jgi:hypothetical protein
MIYHSNTQLKITEFTHQSVSHLHDYLANKSNPWKMYIGHYVEGEPTFTTLGDACKVAGRGYCHEL